jgi:hypothetical protein
MLMCCLGLGLDLMHLLGWVSTHDTHHHMGFLRKIFGSWYFRCVDSWVVTEAQEADHGLLWLTF